jgi:nicotinamide mononucleotide transporter
MFSDSTYLDLIGALLSLVTTYLYIKANANAWKLGILATTLNSILYLSQGIYGQAILESIYFASMWYGLWQWQSKSQAPLKITSLTMQQALTLSLMVIAAIPLCAYLLARYTGSEIAMWDATTCVLSLTAQWLICKKIIQNWVLWFIVDALIITLHFHKSIPFHAILHGIYLIMAIIGYLNWNKLRAEEQPCLT